MKLSGLLRINAILYVISGIAFGLYSPLVLAFFGIMETEGSAVIYWYAVSFARMFGAALFGFGFFIWAAGESITSPLVSTEVKRKTGLAMILGNLIALVVALTQQVSIWGTPAGWIMSAIFLALLGGYARILIKRSWD